MLTVIHLLPYDGIGGAELAARTLSGLRHTQVRFHLRYIFPNVTTWHERTGTFNPFAILRTAFSIAREKPDVLIVSLWRSALAGIFAKLLRPRTRMVLLLHSSKDVHALDFLVTRLAICFSSAVWVDSEASYATRFRRLPRRRVTTISFLAHRLPPLHAADQAKAPAPTFAFWGRLSPPKNLPLTIELFDAIHRQVPQAQLLLIGPDGGVRAELEAECARRGLASAIRFVGPLSHQGIRDIVAQCSFYLQTSTYEGMAMSVVEAMQLGLVPVVTPVGEIPRYCRHGVNAVTVKDKDQAVTDVLALLSDPAAYRSVRQEAIATWDQQALYGESVVAECIRVAAARG